MSFAVLTRTGAGFAETILENKLNGTRVIILPEYGALLHEFSVQIPEGRFNIIDNYPDKASLDAELTKSYKSCKMSPFPCRVPAGRYQHAGRDFELEKKLRDGASIHGLLYDKVFKRVDDFADETQASVVLKYVYNRDDSGYPFTYRCEIRYALMADDILQIQTTILNLDDEDIPLADGWHPYFRLGAPVDQLMIRLSSNTMIEFNDQLVPTGQLLPNNRFVEEERLGETMLDNCFIVNRQDNYAACTLFNPQNNLSISFFPDASYPYLQIYIPPHRNSIAIENLSGAPNCFNNKMGLIQLQPGHSKTFTLHYKINQQ